MSTQVTPHTSPGELGSSIPEEPLVTVEDRKWGSVVVRYPAAQAEEAVRSLFQREQNAPVQVVFGTGQAIKGLGRLSSDSWAIKGARRLTRHLSTILLDFETGLAGPTFSDRAWSWWVYPRHTLRVPKAWEMEAKQALEVVKPERLDERGLPLSWVPAEPKTTPLSAIRSQDDDVETVPDGPPLPELPEGEPEADLDPDDRSAIRGALRTLCRQLGLGDVPLVVRRPVDVRDGFVAGRVWMARSGPRKVAVDVGPNADAAEIWATLIHELAHAVIFEAGHGRDFQARMLDIAEARFGAPYFATARSVVGGAHHTVDAWTAVGIRAALRGAEPPIPETGGDEGQLARIVTRIRKLRRLSTSQAGTPEGRSACAKANDLLVRWDLGTYSVRLAGGIDEQMCDRWVEVGKRIIWRRQLAFEVSRYCGVFALTRASRGWVHYFGRHADVVTAEWFFEIWSAHIERKAEAHLTEFKKARKLGKVTGNVRSERTNFCDSAVLALSRKLDSVGASHDVEAIFDERIDVRRARAEDFAATEHGRRGTAWRSTSGKRIHVNPAGLAAGQAAPMGKGVGVGPGVRGLLGKS